MSTSYHKHDKKASLSLGLSSRRHGFTIVELLIVIVVVAILAAISIIAYNGVTKQAAESTLKSDLKNASTQLGMHHSENGDYPDAEPPGSTNPPSSLKTSTGNTFQYTSTGSTYCLTATSTNTSAAAFNISNSSGLTEGACPGHTGAGSGGGGGASISDGTLMQTITSANCPVERTRAVDARDDHTYWVQKMADDKCWMLTNLAYAGGGTNTYGDTKTLTTGGSATYTAPKYYIPPGASPTTEPTDPSTTGNQYGYLYNWCGAMGGQSSACTAQSTHPSPNQSTSICPAGWRLPAGGSSGQGEFASLNRAFGGSSVGAWSGQPNIAEWGPSGQFMGAFSGYWGDGFGDQGSWGYLWSGSPHPVSSSVAFYAYFGAGGVDPGSHVGSRGGGFAVRCLL